MNGVHVCEKNGMKKYVLKMRHMEQHVQKHVQPTISLNQSQITSATKKTIQINKWLTKHVYEQRFMRRWKKTSNQIATKIYIHFTHKYRINAIKQGYCGQFKNIQKQDYTNRNDTNEPK